VFRYAPPNFILNAPALATYTDHVFDEMKRSDNGKRPAVSASAKRIMQELAELAREPSTLFEVRALDDDLFEVHFTIRGPADSPFEEGLYHGRILLPPEYPYKPPEIMLLTPNGRFETGKRICLSVTQHHVETWQPSWGIRTILTALIGFMPTRGDGAVGALDFTEEERRQLACASRRWSCARCGMDHSSWKSSASTSAEAHRVSSEETSNEGYVGNLPGTDGHESRCISHEPAASPGTEPIASAMPTTPAAPEELPEASTSWHHENEAQASGSQLMLPAMQVPETARHSSASDCSSTEKSMPHDSRTTATTETMLESVDRLLTYVIIALVCALTTVWFL
jgi:ubiquitin-conjugating enzyme E2 J1